MKAKLVTFIVALTLFSSALQAQTVGPGCRIAWDYTLTDQAKINGFQVEVNAKIVTVLPAASRETPCANYTLVEGANTIRLRARSLDSTRFSDWAGVSFTYLTPLPIPTNLRVVQ
jgi:hypothetical protein